MTIQQDADKILRFIYDEYVKNRQIGPEQLTAKFSSWDGTRIDRSIKYLRDKRAIEIVLLLGSHLGVQNFIFKKITPLGIEWVENK